MRVFVICVVLSCGAPTSPPRPIAQPARVDSGEVATAAPIDASVDPPVESPVGAVPLPGGEQTADDRPLDHADTTVKRDELPRAGDRWPTRKRLAYRGRILIALHAAGERLELAVVDTTPTETGYPGMLESLAIGELDPASGPQDGNTFPPRDAPDGSGKQGPIAFAVRVLPRTGASETERKQVVVYRAGTAILVAEKPVTAERWTPRLRIDAPHMTELVAMNPGWH